VAHNLRSRRLVTCVDGFQGQEAEFVIVSLTRTEKLGFLKDNRRVNVMLSRSFQGMVIVGDVAPLLAPSMSSNLVAAFAQHCVQDNLVVDASEKARQRRLLAIRNSQPGSDPTGPATPSSGGGQSSSAAPNNVANRLEAFAHFIRATLATAPGQRMNFGPLGFAWQSHCQWIGMPFERGQLSRWLRTLPDVTVIPASLNGGDSGAQLVPMPAHAAGEERSAAHAGSGAGAGAATTTAAGAGADSGAGADAAATTTVGGDGARTTTSLITAATPLSLMKATFARFVRAKLTAASGHRMALGLLGNAWRSHCLAKRLTYVRGCTTEWLRALPDVSVTSGSATGNDGWAQLARMPAHGAGVERSAAHAGSGAGAGVATTTAAGASSSSAMVAKAEFPKFARAFLADKSKSLTEIGAAWRHHCSECNLDVSSFRLKAALMAMGGIEISKTGVGDEEAARLRTPQPHALATAAALPPPSPSSSLLTPATRDAMTHFVRDTLRAADDGMEWAKLGARWKQLCDDEKFVFTRGQII
ncbi:MAG: hypothetical protein EOO65_04315, partial [Methanosarcinales archaeon]